MKTTDKVYTLRVPITDLAKLHEYGEANDFTVGQLVRRAIREFLEKAEKNG